MSNQQPGSNHRSLTGLVTKLVGDGATYGFINDEIFFPQTNVSGGPAAVGDQVFAECEFSAHLPIKWNATSVKILNKAGQPQPNDPRHDIQQRDMMNQQQQQFNQSAPVAVTYQQHRQQRQQRQMSGSTQQDSTVKQQPQQSSDLTTRLLDHTTGTGDFFGKGFPQPQQQQQQQPESNIQPFQEQPMGPPNFTYTSQLGSAFVQNQFVAPFLNQPPPAMLPQQQQPQQQHQPQQPQQHLLPTNQMHSQNNNQHRQNQHNKGMGGRFNNSHDKNDRQNNRRNQNRNNDKFDRSRSGDREHGHRSSKTGEGRDRSAGRNNKRDDIPVRPSPPPHSSARSSTSISSDRGTKSSRRHYDVQNIPKVQIMTSMNAYNMKQRCPSSVHVPSDLKDIILNRHFRLDVKNTPKPLKFTIEEPKKEVSEAKPTDESMEQAIEETVKVESKEGQVVMQTESDATEQEELKEEHGALKEAKVEDRNEAKSSEHPTPPSSKSDLKLNHKYGVKVILISLPDLEDIYKSVFGPDLDSFNSECKSHSKLDEVISMLCNKGTNNGHSLIGSKFDPILDGFIEGQTNEFERHERQPDLIATCKRAVLEQTSLDLGSCRSWTLLSTFIYNHKADYFSPKASIEYSFIYMPHIWTILGDSLDQNILNRESLKTNEPPTGNNEEVSTEAEVGVEPAVQESAPDNQPDEISTNESNNPKPSTVSNEPEQPVSSLENVADLKVANLKAELDKRGIKYKNGAKKAELVLLYQQCLQADQPKEASSNEESQVDKEVDLEQASKPNDQVDLEEGEVTAEADSPPECDAELAPELAAKRKTSETDVEGEPSSKKICSEGADTSSTVASTDKERKVELIKESFRVKARDEQQQLSLVSLNEATQASRYDQFELSVASIILKESLTQHLSEYILTALVEDHRQKTASGSAASAGCPSNTSSQETSSDTNNNNSAKSAFKNPTSSSTVADQKVNLKELPVDRYVNLAFSYFDSTHMGYVYFEDLNKLFNNTGLTISKRALVSLAGDTEKFNYRTLPDLSHKLKPTYVYEFPEQFRKLPGLPSATPDSENPTITGKTVEYKGVSYDVEQLIQQVRDAETMRVSLVDRFNYAIENSDKQAEEIHVLEVSQKSLAKAIKAQNDELCDLKRERDSIKKKYDNVRKGIKGTVSSLTDLIKDDK